MSTHPYLPLYVDDYEAATAHLTAAEDGVYSRLLRLCWRTPGCSLPNDDAWIARKIRLSAAEFAKVAKPVIEEFFSVQRGRLIQKRLKAEYENISRKKSARVNAGKMGGAAKTLKTKETAPSNASVLPAHTRAFPEPYPEPEKIDEPTVHCPAKPNVVALNEDFNRAWKTFPALGRQRSKSQTKTLPIWREAAKAAGGGDRLAGAVARYVREDATHKGECGPPAFDRWLRDGRWEHWLPDANAPNGGGSAMSPELIAARRALLEQAPEQPNA